MSNSFDLSATFQPSGHGKLAAVFVRFVLVQATLALRNFRRHKADALFHNKAKQFAASLPDVQQVARRCSNR